MRREAQLLASLNHPCIAAIHGLEESGATVALMMELVEGPTLEDRIAQGPVPLDQALPIAKQIAEANGEDVRRGFPNSHHLLVENAGHVDATMFTPETRQAMVGFLKGIAPPARIPAPPLEFVPPVN